MSKETIFKTLAVKSPSDLLFGSSPKPVHCGFDLTIGNGTVFPEVNFTLPTMEITQATWPEVLAHYEDQSEDEQFAEIEAALEMEGTTMMAVPNELVPEVQALIARRQTA